MIDRILIKRIIKCSSKILVFPLFFPLFCIFEWLDEEDINFLQAICNSHKLYWRSK